MNEGDLECLKFDFNTLNYFEECYWIISIDAKPLSALIATINSISLACAFTGRSTNRQTEPGHPWKLHQGDQNMTRSPKWTRTTRWLQANISGGNSLLPSPGIGLNLQPPHRPVKWSIEWPKWPKGTPKSMRDEDPQWDAEYNSHQASSIKWRKKPDHRTITPVKPLIAQPNSLPTDPQRGTSTILPQSVVEVWLFWPYPLLR